MTALTAPRTAEDTAREAGSTPVYVWLTLAFLIANMFSGHWADIGLPVPLDRGLLLMAITLMCLDPRRPALRWHPVHSVMLALIAWTTWSAISAGTLLDEKGLYALLDRIIVPCLMFVIAPAIFWTVRSRDLLLKTLVLIGLYLGATSFFSMIGPKSLVYPRYITILGEASPAAASDPRAAGPFLSGEANGFTMALCLYAASLLLIRGRAIIWRILGGLAVAVCGVGILLTVTRSIWLGAALGLVVVGLLEPQLRRWLLPIAGAVAALIGLALVASPDLAKVVTDRFNTSQSLYDRANTYEAGWRALAEQPLWGIGWSTFIDHGTRWVRQADSYPITTVTIEVHNVFLSRAVETGYIGAALWALVLVLGPLAMVLRRKQLTSEMRRWWLFAIFALAIWVVPSMTSPNPYPLPNTIVWLVAGILGQSVLTRPRPASGLVSKGDLH